MSSQFNRQISDSIGEKLAYGSVFVSGFFYKQNRIIQFADGGIDSFDLSFDCSYSDVNTLQKDDSVDILADDGSGVLSPLGSFLLTRMTPDGGDESNWVTLVLRVP